MAGLEGSEGLQVPLGPKKCGKGRQEQGEGRACCSKHGQALEERGRGGESHRTKKPLLPHPRRPALPLRKYQPNCALGLSHSQPTAMMHGVVPLASWLEGFGERDKRHARTNHIRKPPMHFKRLLLAPSRPTQRPALPPTLLDRHEQQQQQQTQQAPETGRCGVDFGSRKAASHSKLCRESSRR